MSRLVEIGLKSAIVITAGFKEVGREGYHLEQELDALCRDKGITLLGPNCLGIMDTTSRVNATFAVGQPDKGHIAFFSQSGGCFLPGSRFS